MPYTKSQLETAVFAFLEPIHRELYEDDGVHFAMPRLLELAIRKCWLNQVPEDEHTAHIREAWYDLNHKGCVFRYQPEETYP